MWTDFVENAGEIKKYYGDRVPILCDACFPGMTIDGLTKNVRFYLEFRDFPKPLPDGWCTDALACMALQLRLEDVYYNSVNINHAFHQSVVTIEGNEDGIHFLIHDKDNSCILDLNAQKVVVEEFRYYHHSWD